VKQDSPILAEIHELVSERGLPGTWPLSFRDATRLTVDRCFHEIFLTLRGKQETLDKTDLKISHPGNALLNKCHAARVPSATEGLSDWCSGLGEASKAAPLHDSEQVSTTMTPVERVKTSDRMNALFSALKRRRVNQH
jgi:hypothetical protein